MRLRFQMVSKTHILVLGELSQLPWFAWRYGAMGLALYRLNLKNICLLVNATVYAFIGQIFKFHPNTVCQSYFACTPNFRHAIMAFNVATTSGRVIQIQMAFAHFVATSTTFLYFLSFCTGNILWFVWSSSPNLMKQLFCRILTTDLRRRGYCWWYDDDGDHCVEEEAVSGRRRHACFQPLRGRPCSYLVPTLVMFDQQEHCKLHLSTLHLSRQVAKTCRWLLLACAHQSRSTSTAL